MTAIRQFTARKKARKLKGLGRGCVSSAVLVENPSTTTTETRFYEPARLSTPPKPLLSLKPLDVTSWSPDSGRCYLRSFVLVALLKMAEITVLMCEQNSLSGMVFVSAQKLSGICGKV